MKNKKYALVALCLAGILQANAQSGNKDTLSANRPHDLDEVVVTGTRNETDIRHLPMTISIVERQEIEQRFDPSLLPILNEEVPGLFTTSRGIMGYGVSDGAAGGITLRGIGNGAQMLVLIDGHPQYMGLFGHPISDAYQSMLAERMEVLRGPASVLYGSNAMGGVINIVTRKQKTDGNDTHVNVGAGSYGTVQAEATNAFRKGRFSSVVSASYNRTDGHRPRMPFEQYGGYARLGYDIGKQWNAYADLNVTHFNASNPGSVSVPMFENDSKVTRGMASFALQNHYKRTSGALSFFYNWGRHKINDGYTTGESPQESLFHSKDLMMGVSWYQSATFFTGNRLTVGFDYQHFGGESWNTMIADGTKEPGVDKKEDEFAGYVDFRQDIGAWLSLDAGLRVDHHSQVGTELVPQGGLAFHLPKEVELKAMVSKGFRNPTIREMYMFPPQNPDLEPERLVNYELSLTQQFPIQGIRYELNLYYINGDNVIQTDRSLGKPRNVNSGEIENWGAEALIDYRITPHWNLTANYSWLHMEHPVLAAPEHKLYASVKYQRNRWMLATGVQYIKNLYTTTGTTEKTQDFTLWNLRVAYRLWHGLQLYAKGENLLAQRYEINAGYPMPRATIMAGVNVHF